MEKIAPGIYEALTDVGYIIHRSWGRIGRTPQDLEHNYVSLTAALKKANSKYREKLRKGYIQKARPWSQGYLDFIKQD